MTAHYCPECGHEHLPAGDPVAPSPDAPGLDPDFEAQNHTLTFVRSDRGPVLYRREIAPSPDAPGLDVERLARALQTDAVRQTSSERRARSDG